MKKLFIPVVIIIISLLLYNYFSIDIEDNSIYVSPKKGSFEIKVSVTGELRAINSIDIKGPTRTHEIEIHEMKISRLVPEGTNVKKGDFVAELDKSNILQKLKDAELKIDKNESIFNISKLDSNSILSQARDNLENLNYAVEEMELKKQQSIYESPTVKRQVEIDYLKAKRSYEHSKSNYENQVKKSIANLRVAGADLSKVQMKMQKILGFLDDFTIRAPADGMVIYARDWNGSKKEVNSTIRRWDPIVATLPDLSKMKSITYVNEVDIQKIKKNQNVEIGIDANPDKRLTGTVIEVANIGEQRRNSDAKVFEVVIEINEKDTTLLPSMTTSNDILISSKPETLYIVLEAIHSFEYEDKQKINYVYLKNGYEFIKQEVKLGLINDNYAEILDGIKLSDEIYLSIPDNSEELEISKIIEKKPA